MLSDEARVATRSNAIAHIGRAAEHVGAGLAADQDRLAGERGLVQRGRSGADDPVDRHDLSLANENPIAGDERLDRHLRKAIVAVTDGGLGDAAEQSGHFAPRAALREVFEQLPAGIHQRDHDPGQRLADRKCAGHRQRGDDVETDAALLELGDDFEQQSRKDQKR